MQSSKSKKESRLTLSRNWVLKYFFIYHLKTPRVTVNRLKYFFIYYLKTPRVTVNTVILYTN